MGTFRKPVERLGSVSEPVSVQVCENRAPHRSWVSGLPPGDRPEQEDFTGFSSDGLGRELAADRPEKSELGAAPPPFYRTARTLQVNADVGWRECLLGLGVIS